MTNTQKILAIAENALENNDANNLDWLSEYFKKQANQVDVINQVFDGFIKK